MELTPEISILSLLLIGFGLGLQHAIEADHIAAVSTLVSEKNKPLYASFVGALWGVGHTLALFGVGVVVIFLKVNISPEDESRLEAVVGAMLILLGLNALRKLFSAAEVHVHKHEHGELEHVHLHRHVVKSSDGSHHRASFRSVAVGMVHGLAGSAALMLLILPLIKEPAAGLLYILVFGAGSIGGMMAMSLMISLPLRFASGRSIFFDKGLRAAAAILSLGLGFYIVYEKLIAA